MKRGLAQMLKGGVIMDVVDVEQARIAEARLRPPRPRLARSRRDLARRRARAR